jgi:1-acyl-sn-glycerol-3-phosphate acyltransferase
MILYKLAHIILNIIFKLFYSFKVTGRENLPLSGGLILTANHSSYLDPPVLGCAAPFKHQVFFMAKIELFAKPVLGKIISAMGAFPVKRGEADRKALKTALEILKKGGWLGIFPEGTRSKDGELQEGELGAVLLANLAKVPIVPVAITGTQNFKPKPITVKFGEPIALPQGKLSKADLKTLTRQIMEAIAALKNTLT